MFPSHIKCHQNQKLLPACYHHFLISITLNNTLTVILRQRELDKFLVFADVIRYGAVEINKISTIEHVIAAPIKVIPLAIKEKIIGPSPSSKAYSLKKTTPAIKCQKYRAAEPRITAIML